ncbi:MAG: hypothetical protein JWR05_1745 [Mucilaginibacter sp.]|nr:hypothetical protein [Mucilaginibacter sp.]
MSSVINYYASEQYLLHYIGRLESTFDRGGSEGSN